jgi:hypothetical protein
MVGENVDEKKKKKKKKKKTNFVTRNRFGLAAMWARLTVSKACRSVMRVAGPIIRYASATVEEREIPAWQCTSTRNRPAGGDWGRPLRQSQNQPTKKSKSALNIERSKAPSASAIGNLKLINPTKSATSSSLSTRAISNLLKSINPCNQQPPQVYQPVQSATSSSLSTSANQQPQVHQPQTYNLPKLPTPKAPSASAISNLSFINPTKSATFSSLSTRAISNLLKSINQCNQHPQHPQVHQPQTYNLPKLPTPATHPPCSNASRARSMNAAHCGRPARSAGAASAQSRTGTQQCSSAASPSGGTSGASDSTYRLGSQQVCVFTHKK